MGIPWPRRPGCTGRGPSRDGAGRAPAPRPRATPPRGTRGWSAVQTGAGRVTNGCGLRKHCAPPTSRGRGPGRAGPRASGADDRLPQRAAGWVPRVRQGRDAAPPAGSECGAVRTEQARGADPATHAPSIRTEGGAGAPARTGWRDGVSGKGTLGCGRGEDEPVAEPGWVRAPGPAGPGTARGGHGSARDSPHGDAGPQRRAPARSAEGKVLRWHGAQLPEHQRWWHLGAFLGRGGQGRLVSRGSGGLVMPAPPAWH